MAKVEDPSLNPEVKRNRFMSSGRPERNVSVEEIDQYRELGVVKLAGLFDGAWIEHLRAATEVAMNQPGPHAEEYARGTGRFFGDLDVSRRIAPFREFVHDSPAAAIVGTLMESGKANFFYDQLLVKEPGTSERTPWHQDQPYWAVRGRQVASLWLPLDPVSTESSLKFVSGSHLWREHNPHHFIDDTPYAGTGLPELPDIDAEPGKYELLGWDLEPGDCLVFQAMSSSAQGQPFLTGGGAFPRGGRVMMPATLSGVAIPTFDPTRSRS
jgi:ectoine hydroxylase-related dioxygenase (phytanoyl-CoA dioxygenase family)